MGVSLRLAGGSYVSDVMAGGAPVASNAFDGVLLVADGALRLRLSIDGHPRPRELLGREGDVRKFADGRVRLAVDDENAVDVLVIFLHVGVGTSTVNAAGDRHHEDATKTVESEGSFWRDGW